MSTALDAILQGTGLSDEQLLSVNVHRGDVTAMPVSTSQREPPRANPIPAELRERPQWVGWKSVPAEPKPRKLPIDPKTGKAASSTDPATWADYNTATAGLKPYGLAGVGFVFTESDPFAGVDLDDCRDPQTGEIEGWAQAIIAALNSYAEVSPSGTGVKIFLKAKLPANAKHNVKCQTGSVEMYDCSRYFTVTGQHVPGTPTTIEDRQAEVTTVYAGVFGAKAVRAARTADAAPSDSEIVHPNRWPHLRSLAGTMIERGMYPTAIEAGLLEENARRCAPPLDEKELREKLTDMVRRYPSPAPSTLPHDEETTTAGTPWPDPLPLGGELPAVQAFDLALLPETLRPLVEDTAELMQVPLDYPAAAAVLCLAGVTSRRATIQPKALDASWTVVPNLWGGIVAPPGLMKSPIITTIARPLAQIEAEWRTEYDSAVGNYEQQQEEAELKRATWRELYKAAQKADKPLPVRPNDSLTEPVARRLITQDATAEKLHELLRDNPAGVMVVRDELSGWLATLDKPGREGERGFFLSAWNGDTPYTMDRIGRGSVHVDACCVSMLGGIQPARLRSYLADALIDGPQNDGLFQRFQVLVFPDIPKSWRYVDRSPDSAAIEGAERLYRRVTQLEAANPLRFHFAADAQELFVDWLTDLEGKLRGDDLHPALVAHLAKYRSLMPSLALLFELAGGGTETVSLQHTQQAAAFCEYLESHARRIYSMLISPERQAAAELGRHLKAGWNPQDGMFTVRDVYQNDWRGLNTPDAVRRALPLLEDAGWIRRMEQEQRAGRPPERYAINPKLGAGD